MQGAGKRAWKGHRGEQPRLQQQTRGQRLVPGGGPLSIPSSSGNAASIRQTHLLNPFFSSQSRDAFITPLRPLPWSPPCSPEAPSAPRCPGNSNRNEQAGRREQGAGPRHAHPGVQGATTRCSFLRMGHVCTYMCCIQVRMCMWLRMPQGWRSPSRVSPTTAWSPRGHSGDVPRPPRSPHAKAAVAGVTRSLSV